MGDMADYYLEQDLYNDIWENLGAEEPIWFTKDGKQMLISKMTEQHIKNCMNMLKRTKQDSDFWIAVFEDELKDRKNK